MHSGAGGLAPWTLVVGAGLPPCLAAQSRSVDSLSSAFGVQASRGSLRRIAQPVSQHWLRPSHPDVLLPGVQGPFPGEPRLFRVEHTRTRELLWRAGGKGGARGHFRKDTCGQCVLSFLCLASLHTGAH